MESEQTYDKANLLSERERGTIITENQELQVTLGPTGEVSCPQSQVVVRHKEKWLKIWLYFAGAEIAPKYT